MRRLPVLFLLIAAALGCADRYPHLQFGEPIPKVTLSAPPGTTGGRNWLCVRVRGRQRGNIWQMSTSYAMSGPYGWVQEMYRAF